VRPRREENGAGQVMQKRERERAEGRAHGISCGVKGRIRGGKDG